MSYSALLGGRPLLHMSTGGRSMIGGAAVTMSDTAPAIRTDGMLWCDTTIWRMFISYQGMWIQMPT